MANQYKNKVVYNGQTLVDLTSDTVTSAVLSQGYTAHDASGAPIIGTKKEPLLQDKTVDADPDLTIVVVPDDGYDALNSVEVNAIGEGTVKTTDTTIEANPTISIDFYNGLIISEVSSTNYVSPMVTKAGYVSSSAGSLLNGTIEVSGSNMYQLSTQASKSVTPTKSQQTAVAAGKYTTGTVTVDAIPSQYVDTTDGTASAGDILKDKTAYVNGSKVTGSMTNRGAVSETLDCGESYTIPTGYHNGSGTVTANSLASQTGVDSGYSAATNATIRSGYQAWVNGVKRTGSMATLTASNFSGTHSGTTAGASSTYTVKSTSAGYVANSTTVNSLTAGTSATIATTAATGTKTINCIPGYYNKISVNQTAAYNAGKAAGAVQFTKVGTLTDFGYTSTTGSYSSKTGTKTFTVKSTISAYASLTINNFFFRDITTKANSSNVVSLYLKLYSYNASTGVLTVQYTVSSSGGSFTDRQTTFSADVYCAWSA